MGPGTAARWVLAAIALAGCSGAWAETRVYLLRGWFGVFSTGMDAVAETLQARGVRAEAIGHLAWKSAVEKILEARKAGRTGPIVLVGHSQGGNNVIDMARELAPHKVRVDLLITLAPFLQDAVPPNVARAVNYYQSPGWGTALVAEPGFAGELANIDVQDSGTFHVNIDKNARVQAEIVASIVALKGRTPAEKADPAAPVPVKP
jgi:pimeloyl-ACP methyl ester carboxylesterase